ncbi:hypothetical protein C8R47DRAFT_1138383 [Mycena vitilis]|nr:hypothetical protein C8R47DRAFT_1138383 [Mycena vitilis]
MIATGKATNLSWPLAVWLQGLATISTIQHHDAYRPVVEFATKSVFNRYQGQATLRARNLTPIWLGVYRDRTCGVACQFPGYFIVWTSNGSAQSGSAMFPGMRTRPAFNRDLGTSEQR